VGLLVGIATTAQVLFVHSNVGNDATAFCTGALALWAVVRYRGNRAGLFLLSWSASSRARRRSPTGFGVGTARSSRSSRRLRLLAFPVADRIRESLWPRLKIVFAIAGGYVVANLMWTVAFELTQIKGTSRSLDLQPVRPEGAHVPARRESGLGVLQPVRPDVDPLLRGRVARVHPEAVQRSAHQRDRLLVTLAVLACTYGSWMFLSRKR